MKNVVPAIALLITAPAFADIDCDVLFQEHIESDMELSYEEFDQTMNTGFRVLGAAGCHEQAADLILAYIAHNDAEQSSLRWHVAQLRASHGDYEQAIEYANSVLLEEEDFAVRALRWNDYVLATIAFLEKDKEALVHHRNQVEKGVGEHAGNELNLRLLDSLIRHFDQSYEYALMNIE